MQVVIPDFDELEEGTGFELNDPLPPPGPPPGMSPLAPGAAIGPGSPQTLPARLEHVGEDPALSAAPAAAAAPPPASAAAGPSTRPAFATSTSAGATPGAPGYGTSQSQGASSGPPHGSELWHGRSGSNASSENSITTGMAVGTGGTSAPPTTSSFPFRLPNNSGGLSLSGKERDHKEKEVPPKEKGIKKGSLASLRAAIKNATSSSNPLAMNGSQPASNFGASHEHLPPLPATLFNSAPSFRPSFSSSRSYDKAAQSVRHYPASVSTRTHQRTGSLVSVAHGAASDSEGYNMDPARNHGHLHKRSQLSGSSIAGSSFEGNFPGAPPVPPFPLHLQGDAFKSFNASDSSLEVLRNVNSRSTDIGGERAYTGTGGGPGAIPFSGETILAKGVGIPDAQTPWQFALNSLLAEFTDLAQLRAAYLNSEQSDMNKFSSPLVSPLPVKPLTSGQSRGDNTKVESAFQSVCRSLGRAAATDLPLVWSTLFNWRSVQIGSRQSDLLNGSTAPVGGGDADEYPLISNPSSAPPTPSKAQRIANQTQLRRLQLTTLISLIDALTVVLDSVPPQASASRPASIDPVQNMLSFLHTSLQLRGLSEQLFQRAQSSLGNFATSVSALYRTRMLETILSSAQKALAGNPTEKPDIEIDLQIKLLGRMKIIVCYSLSLHSPSVTDVSLILHRRFPWRYSRSAPKQSSPWPKCLLALEVAARTRLLIR